MWAPQAISAPVHQPHCMRRADNTARKQDKGANQQVGRWDVKRKEFESEISRNGWTPAAQARADAFLHECEGAPGKRWETCARTSLLQRSHWLLSKSALADFKLASASASVSTPGMYMPEATRTIVISLVPCLWQKLVQALDHCECASLLPMHQGPAKQVSTG